ncbi:hypothetical protein [Actinomadura hibisca]|uniref:hypothetical protein n=1 Tax=Actinomadura hibisca TaxID=68565 RepID=UPI000832A5C6|nr:hypothetical protein [Actinomadura hibisca]
MRLLRAWLAAFGVVVAGLVIDVLAVLVLGRHVTSWPDSASTVLLVHVPWTLTLLVAALLSARLYGPARGVEVRQLLAVFTVPVLFAVGSALVGSATGSALLGVVSAVEALVGAFAGWFIMRRLSASSGAGDGYFPAH